MTNSAIGRVIRASSRLVINPTNLAAEFPYGGKQLGKARACTLAPLGQSYRVEAEGLGRSSDVLHGGSRHLFSCFLRGWDDAAIELLLPDGWSRGDATRHATWSAPAEQDTGVSALSRAVVLLVVPDDVVHVPCLLMLRAVAWWSSGSELAFRRRDELGLPLSFECLRDTGSRVLQIGRLQDLTL